MNKILVSLVLVWVAMAGGAAAADLPPALVDPYLRIQAQLAEDKVEGVKQDAAAIASAATALGAQGKALLEAAQKLEAAADLKTARAAFGPLSEAMVSYAKTSGATFGPNVHQAYCPMVNKPWLQKGEQIRNPYYGSEMLTCGAIRK